MQTNLHQNNLTENGAMSLSTTGSKCLDFYFKTVRKITQDTSLNLLSDAWNEDPLSALKLVFHTRDCREGKGERQIFKWCCEWLAQNQKKHLIHNLKYIPQFGRWEDLLWLLDSDNEVSNMVANMYSNQIKEDKYNMMLGKPVTLCAKWAPTEGKKHDKKLNAVVKICAALKCSKQYYRKQYISPLREYINIVEKLMCSQKWSEINYSKVPSNAMNKLRKAFCKNDAQRFSKYQEKLKNKDSDVKINATTVQPHECIREYMRKIEQNQINQSLGETNEMNIYDQILESQWDEITKRTQTLGTFKNSIVLSDVSGSMNGEPMEVSIALGILISSLTEQSFKNKIITFETKPKLHNVTGDTLREKVENVMKMDWGGDTNLEAVFDLILSNAKFHNLTEEQMPSRLYIISDMQFNSINNNDITNFELIKQKYNESRYKMPQIVFWNVRGSTSDFTNKHTDADVAMISGFSPSVLKNVVSGDDFNPIGVLKNIINDVRLNCITLAP